jgi:flagellar L-ring protein FlgH
MKRDKVRCLITGTFIGSILAACAPSGSELKVVPSLEYARSLGAGQRGDVTRAEALNKSPLERHALNSRQQPTKTRFQEPRFRLAANDVSADSLSAGPGQVVTNLPAENNIGDDFQMHESTTPNSRDYNGPLSLGDPGVSASLWQESRGETSLYHDFRAWQPMDIITIVVTEKSTGNKQADTNIKTNSSFLAGIKNFFGYENDVIESNSKQDGTPKIDLANLINATMESEFDAEGETTRSDSLSARLSAMIVEVLPGGVLRIEGERIISMNNEEQIMVISGLARTRDINSENQIDSSRIANLRVDYFGRGTVGSAQFGGWFSNLLRLLWPF